LSNACANKNRQPFSNPIFSAVKQLILTGKAIAATTKLSNALFRLARAHLTNVQKKYIEG
jgi:hypothetical protein